MQSCLGLAFIFLGNLLQMLLIIFFENRFKNMASKGAWKLASFYVHFWPAYFTDHINVALFFVV